MADNTPLQKDWFIFGFLTGAAASIVKSGLNYVIEGFKVPTTRYGSMASGVILGKKVRLRGLLKARPKSTGEWAIGYVADTVGGGLIGTAMSYVYMKTPPGNEVLKGAIGGAAFWAMTLTLGRHLRIGGFEKATPMKMASLLVTSLAYGGIQGWMIGKYGASVTDQSHPLLVKEVSSSSYNRGRFVREPLRRPR